MRRSALALAALLAIVGTGAASAADMAPRYTKAPPPLPLETPWTGWYVGLNAGAAINDSSYNLMPSGCFINAAAPCGGPLTNNPLRSYSAGQHNVDGTAGGQFGYNYQFSPIWVAGFETDINWNGTRQTDTVVQPVAAPLAGSFLHSVSTSLDWFGTVRGRVGFLAAPNLLLYGTGGLAYGQVKSSTAASFTTTADVYAGTFSDTRVGWTAGAGGEWMASRNWSLKAEYLYVDLGKTNYTNACVTAVCGAFAIPPTYNTSVTTREHIVRVGFNYHFNSPVVAKY